MNTEIKLQKFVCPICHNIHKTTSKIGKKHLISLSFGTEITVFGRVKSK